jgi:hypothetical protein
MRKKRRIILLISRFSRKYWFVPVVASEKDNLLGQQKISVLKSRAGMKYNHSGLS